MNINTFFSGTDSKDININPLLTGNSDFLAAAQSDFNVDGVADAAVTSWRSPEVMLLLGASPPLRTARLPGGENPWGLVSVDLNEDGKDDLVIVDNAHPHATIYLSCTGPRAP